MIGKTITISSTVKYYFYSKHRGKPTHTISVWTIDYQEEFDCFKQSINKEWVFGNNSWGFVMVNNNYEKLGENTSNPKLYFAKFVFDGKSTWHGYPADLRNKPNDKPQIGILSKWLTEKLISKAIFRRIQQGQI